MRRSLAILVPLYNDLGNVAPFYDRARATADSLPDVSWQLVFVNDGSTDGSFEKACELRAADERVKVISLSRNFGYHAVLLAGLTTIPADLYVMIDVDCEDPPELLAAFVAAIDGGADVAYGIRSNRIEGAPITFFRRLFYYVNRGIADSDIVLWMSEFAMITRQVRDAIIAPRTTYPFLRAELGYAGFARVGVPYVRGARQWGSSHFNVWRMTRFAVAAFLASSTFPLRFILYLATVAAVLFPVIVVGFHLDAPGITSLAAIVILYFLLFALSMLALYQARTYKNGVARPVFIIDKDRTFL